MLIITGTGRSGTGMLARLFCGHHEFRVTYLIDKYCDSGDSADPFGAFDKRLQAVLDLHQGVEPKTFIDSSNLYIYLLDALWALYPDARFILGVRDGRDFVRSAITRSWHTRTSFDTVPQKQSPYYARWQSMSPIERATWIWTNRNEIAFDMLERIPRNRWMLVRVEDLDEQLLDRLEEFAGHPIKNKKPVKARVNANLVQGFPCKEEWSEDELRAFYAIAGGMMKKLEYGEAAG